MSFPDSEAEVRWRITIDESAPWIGVHPREGVAPGVACFVVYPGIYDAAASSFVSTRVMVELFSSDSEATRLSREIELRVLPDPKRLQRILWVWPGVEGAVPVRDRTDPYRMRALADKLAAPPLYFSQDEAWGPIQEPLGAYTVVVVSADAASYGAVTRQALLDYVVSGGGLLVFAEHSSEVEAPATNWLDPVGIHVNPAIAVNGQFAASGGVELGRYWDNFDVRGGALLQVSSSDSIVAGNAETTVLAAAQYGQGRVAVLASKTPLTTAALESTAHWKFAGELFRWLARARLEVIDADGDGLPDGVEDRNGNQAVDPGETNRLKRDSDGDGVPDDLEDLNRNGWADEGESSAVNADSDGDGLFDGADPGPIPPYGALHLAGIELSAGPGPVEGPAEGGTMLLLNGRNFSSQTQVYFDDRLSPRARHINSSQLLVESPAAPTPEGGSVAVRVVDAAGAQASVLPEGYRYRPLSTVRLSFAPLERPQPTRGGVTGAFSVRLEALPDAAIGQVVFETQLRPPIPGAVLEFRADDSLVGQSRAVWFGEVAANRWRLVIGPGSRRSNLVSLGQIYWTIPNSANQGAAWFDTAFFIVTATNGVLLNTEPASIAFRLAGATRPRQ